MKTRKNNKQTIKKTKKKKYIGGDVATPQGAIATPQGAITPSPDLVAFRAMRQASQADKIPCPVDAKGVVEQLVEASKLPEGAKGHRAAKNCQQKFTAKKKNV